jgi:hypothetical protein
MKQMSCVFAIVSLIAVSCGTSPDKPSYDTKANPLFFPSAALSLIDRVESGTLLSLDSVTEAFASLYTEQPDLLDNENWRGVVSALGSKFRYHGDQLAGRGFEHYNTAYGQFLLAAFARPDDPLVMSSATLFSVWPKAIADSIFPPFPDSLWLETQDLGQRIAILKYFVFGDSIKRAFAREYLVRPLMTHYLHRDTVATEVLTSLPTADRAFLASLNLVSFNDIRPLALFDEPEIELLAYQLVRLDSMYYRAEVYFRPKAKLPDSVKVALWINPEDSTTNPTGKDASFVPFNFSPDVPSEKWSKRKVVGVSNRFGYPGSIAKISLGLYQESDKQTRYFGLSGNGGQLIKLSPVIDSLALSRP